MTFNMNISKSPKLLSERYWSLILSRCINYPRDPKPNPRLTIINTINLKLLIKGYS